MGRHKGSGKLEPQDEGNVIVISNRANSLKKDATVDEIIKLAEWYQKISKQEKKVVLPFFWDDIALPKDVVEETWDKKNE